MTVTHATTDLTRLAWGFELTALVNGTNAKAGDIALINATTTRLRNNAGPGSARQYVEQAAGGIFANQTLGASWSFNWTAPATNVGAITFYASGILADNSGDENGDPVLNATAVTQPAVAVKPFGDFDGDNKTDFAIYRHNTNGANESSWYILNSLNGTSTQQLFGLDTDLIMPGDYIGDTKADIAVWRASEGAWYISQGSRTTFTRLLWGVSNDIPVPADFDGDAKADPGIYRPGTGTWYALQSLTNTVRAQQLGLSTDTPVPADFDGDAKADFALYRSSTSVWYVLQSQTGTLRSQAFGVAGDVPVVGDYDGDGKSDIAIFRAGDWYVLRSSTGATTGGHFGQAGDIAVPAAYLR